MRVETFNNTRYSLEIQLGESVGRIILRDCYSEVEFANGDYRYSAFVESGGHIARLDGLHAQELTEEEGERGLRTVTLTGRLGGPDAAPRITVVHSFRMPQNAEYLEETLCLRNDGPRDTVLRSYRFGFRKLLQRPEAFGGPGIDVEHYRMVAVPFRLQPDGNKHDYPLDDMYHGRYLLSQSNVAMRVTADLVDRGRARSEAWAWTDGENGLLIAKYNPDLIEYSLLETEALDGDRYLNFGGAAPSLYNEPFEARSLPSGRETTFGLTRLHFYEGLWRRGSYLFRDYMNGLGHGRHDDYDPPIHWNELYNIGWHHNDETALAENYNIAALEAEAARAREIGCDLLYLDPGWEVCEGSTRWDEMRLGRLDDFVRRIRADFGLGVGLRTIGRAYCDDYPGMYRRTSDSLTGYYAPYSSKPFYEPCFASRQYSEEKQRRILELADAGLDFLMFDEFDWRGQCFDSSHGHPVPTTPSIHAKAVAELVREVHRRHPSIIVEMHDPIWPWGVRYAPVYYLDLGEDTFEELWAFEFMWNPLEDLLSGRALCLFYYNLAYDIPLYLHLDMGNDNDACLAFWWYASTCRHIGIGGGANNPARFAAYKAALAEYRSLKDLYARGTFYAYDELTHLHVLPETGRCAINTFNLTENVAERDIDIRLNDLELFGDVQVEGAPYELVGGKLVLQVRIPPFSPLLVKITSR